MVHTRQHFQVCSTPPSVSQSWCHVKEIMLSCPQQERRSGQEWTGSQQEKIGNIWKPVLKSSTTKRRWCQDNPKCRLQREWRCLQQTKFKSHIVKRKHLHTVSTCKKKNLKSRKLVNYNVSSSLLCTLLSTCCCLMHLQKLQSVKKTNKQKTWTWAHMLTELNFLRGR